MSSLDPGDETNAGRLYRLLCETSPRANLSLRYEQGPQWERWRDALIVIEGRGINRQIQRAYGAIASRYLPGDRIFLFGYSRGAYAVRSLAGLIDRVGLLKGRHANSRNIRQAYRHYQRDPDSEAARQFADLHCYPETRIELIGVWDTVKALGLRFTGIGGAGRRAHEFHDHSLGSSIQNGCHALALDETRDIYRPVLWETQPDRAGAVVQMWFRGSHGDIGGHLNGYEAARPLANIPLVWMLEKVEACGLALPDGWKDRFPTDATAPSVGNTRGWAKLFWHRSRRQVGTDPSEQIHASVDQATFSSAGSGARPRA